MLINYNCYEETFIVLIKRKKKRWNVALFYDFLSEGGGRVAFMCSKLLRLS